MTGTQVKPRDGCGHLRWLKFRGDEVAAKESFINAFTVDVEDFYQVSAFEKYIPRDTWEEYPQRVPDSTATILDLLTEKGVKGTFFVLGWVAQKFPQLVRKIAENGHEIGFHSNSHSLIYNMTPEAFRNELHQGKAMLEDIVGAPVEAFRAPSFSITQKSLWAFDVLVEEGFRYDSSVFPIHHDRYGIPNAPIEIHPVETKSGTLWEFPPSVVRHFGMNFPVSGGGYFRLYPYWLTRRCLRGVHRAGRPFVFYVHPWEVDPEQPKLPFGSRATQFRHRVGLKRNLRKLQRLLSDFTFGTLSQTIEDWKSRNDTNSTSEPKNTSESNSTNEPEQPKQAS